MQRACRKRVNESSENKAESAWPLGVAVQTAESARRRFELESVGLVKRDVNGVHADAHDSQVMS